MGTNDADKRVADAMARARAERAAASEAERLLDEQSRAARGANYAIAQLRGVS